MNKFNYPKLERVDTEIGRHYRDSNNNLVPSVTTVLSGTSDTVSYTHLTLPTITGV